jgi:dynein intermediate chain 2, axonemal
MDGVMDVWDYFYRQNEVAYSHKIGNAALSSISLQASSPGGWSHC